MQRSIESDFEDENEICYTSKRRAQPRVQHYDEDSLPSSSWTNPNENDIEEDQRSSSIDYYHHNENDDEEDEIFNLPISSNDLSVAPQQALHLATIYEFLRHFSPILRLSPFLFEHFCTSIIQSIDINNILFSQIHICLLRLLIKQDDDDGITYASETDIKGIIDLSFVTMDYITWPYILQLYITSHPQLKMLTTIIKEYPFNTTIEDKIEVLLALCNVALTTKTIRREFDDTKPKQHDDNCRQCQKRGDLLCCDRCEATYHLACLNPPLTSVPTVEWFCPVCEQNQIHGVSDCTPPRENRPFYLRHRCIGHDREQRRYWFVCRRLFVEDETGEDVRYYSTLDQFDALLSCLDPAGSEKLLVYRLQKRYNDIARCMQITANLHDSSLPLDQSPTMTHMIHSALDYVPQLDNEDEDDDDDQKSLSMFTDGLMPCYFEENLTQKFDYEHLLDRIKLKILSKEDVVTMHGQIDGIVDNDDNNEKDSKSFVKKREFFVHSTNNYGYPTGFNKQNLYNNDFSKSNDSIPMKRFYSSSKSLLEDRLRHAHNIYTETEVTVHRLNDNDIDETIWQRYEQYQTMNRFPSHTRGNKYSNNTNNRPSPANHPSYPRSNYYRDYYTGNNYEDEDGMLLDNEYDDFGDDFFQQEENIDEFDMPFRKYESSRVYRGTSRGRPRGRGRPPLYGGRAGRGSHFGHPPRGVNHLTTGSFQSSQRLIQPKIESPKPNDPQQQQQPPRNKRKPAKIKPMSATAQEEKPRRPGKVLRSGRISRKPRRDSETDFGSDNSDDSGAKDKETGSDDDEEFNLTQLGLGFGNASNIAIKGGRDGSSSSNDSLAGGNRSLTNFAAFAQNQLLAANLANGLIAKNEESSDDSDFSADGFGSDESDDILSQKAKTNNEIIDDEELDDFTYSQTMLSLINSMQPSHVKIDFDLVTQNKNNDINKVDILPTEGHLHYENYYQTNPLATKKQMLLSERDRRAHLARKFSINNSIPFAWYSPSSSITSNYFIKNLSDILRITLVYFENTIPLPFMHSHWKRYRYIWAKQLLDIDTDISLSKLIYLLLQFEACIKPVSYFDLFTDQVGYIKFRRETEKERDEAKKEEKDAFIRRKIDADSIIQNVHFTRPLKHSIHKQRGEEYRLAGGQGWTFIRSTRRSLISTKTKNNFDINSLLTRRENMSNAILNERNRIINLLETKLKNDLGNETNIENELNNLLLTSKDDNDDFIDDLAFINYKIIDYNGSSYRYPVMLEDTRRPFHLTATTNEKNNLINPFQLPLPWTFAFDNQITPNIFILPSYILRRLARASMTLTDAPGFINSRLSGIGTRFGWPYPCGRPSVRTAWCYKVQTSTSFFALAHHIKYLWNCIRWDLLTEKLSSIDESSITTHIDNDGIQTLIQVLAKRDSGPYNSYCEYFVRKTIHTQTNDSSNFNIPSSKSRSRAVPHPSSVLTPNRIILTEQWLPERQLQPNQIKYYYQCLQDKTFKRLHKKTNDEKKQIKKKNPIINPPPSTQQTAKPFIVRIPHLQPKSTLNTESGKVVIVKATGESPSTNLPLQQKSFSVVKLADGQIILVPTTTVQQNENSVSKIIKAPSPPKSSQPQTISISPQERRLRPIAPAPITSIQTSNELLNSLLAQQQLILQQQSETISTLEPTLIEDIPLTTISETVIIDTNDSIIKPTPIVTHKTKNIRKTVPIPSVNDDKKLKVDPEQGIRLRICEAILRSMIARIEREQNQESMKKRLKNQNTIVQPKPDHRHLVLTRLLNDRVDSLRQDFIGNRLNKKTALVKEQVQTQRLKQQQLILKQQQQQAESIKQEESSSDDEKPKTENPPSIPPKKVRKSTGNEIKTKRQGTPKSSEQKPKSTLTKRTRPLPPTKTADNEQPPPSKKARRSLVNPPPSEQRESSDNDENLLKNRKTSSSSSTTTTTTTAIAKMKSTEKSKKIITIKNSSNKKEKTEINLSDINCSCQKTDSPEKFFIQCEICSRWLHGTCVGLTPRLAQKMKEFICEDCRLLTQKAKERLYCICQTSYDESKFYIGCDVCADWLHGSCVNITPEQAEKFEVYVCPRCSTEKKQEFLNKPINNETKKELLNLTDQLSTHKMAWPFQKPVDIKDAPNYYTIIKDPMDLTTLKTKVMNSKFKTICDYIRDVNKIFNNCRLFNPINSTFSLCANVVDNYFRQLLENLMIKNDT
ncbi:unnamed protein product [Adineta steineri]|uniref:Uncharacterized protein n=1 Tax=Adineta steineri TaxID=433720 RepID=A0A819JI44_9BILA|nr:unnamed protein product [Adineta steineri]